MSSNTGVCPKCNGSCRRPAGDSPYKEVYAGYDAATDTLRCDNCGGQTMGLPNGVVNLLPDGSQMVLPVCMNILA